MQGWVHGMLRAVLSTWCEVVAKGKQAHAAVYKAGMRVLRRDVGLAWESWEEYARERASAMAVRGRVMRVLLHRQEQPAAVLKTAERIGCQAPVLSKSNWKQVASQAPLGISNTGHRSERWWKS